MEDFLKKRDDESYLTYYKRITENRIAYDLDYAEWAELIIGEKKYSSENARKAYYIVKPLLDKLDSEEIEKLPKNKIDEIVEAIGELDVKKMLVRNDTSKLNKIKRDLVKNVEIANALTEYMDREFVNFGKLNYEKISIDETGKKLIIALADWHVGYVINGYKGNHYNYEIANLRLSHLLSEVQKEINRNQIQEVIILNLGDLTEGTYMRKNQAYECEFNSNEQTVMASELLYNFITSVSEMQVNVDVFSVGGNHQRGNGDKDANLESDNNNIVVIKTLRKFFTLAKNHRVTVHDIDFMDDTATFNVNGLNAKILHGDNRTGNEKKLYDGEISMDDVKYDIILRGHYHNFNVSSQNNGGYVITCGCLFGYNPYSVKKMSCTTNASQSLIIVGDREIEYIRDVNLQIIN